MDGRQRVKMCSQYCSTHLLDFNSFIFLSCILTINLTVFDPFGHYHIQFGQWFPEFNYFWMHLNTWKEENSHFTVQRTKPHIWNAFHRKFVQHKQTNQRWKTSLSSEVSFFFLTCVKPFSDATHSNSTALTLKGSGFLFWWLMQKW